jgi:Uma2 family endonuclease
LPKADAETFALHTKKLTERAVACIIPLSEKMSKCQKSFFCGAGGSPASSRRASRPRYSILKNRAIIALRTEAKMIAPEKIFEAVETLERLRMTEDEFLEWYDEDIKAEWVDGEVIVHSPASATHVRLVKFLLKLLDDFVIAYDLGEVLGPEFQIRFAKLRRRVPDILFIAKARRELIQRNHFEGAPDLIVEIVSPDSIARDWRVKYHEYEAAGVREYWIVEPAEQRVEAYALNANGEYEQIEAKHHTIHSTVLPGFFLKTDWLWQEPLPKVADVLREIFG